MIYRLAVESDFPQLTRLRWELHTEHHSPRPGITWEIFLPDCLAFLQRGHAFENWAF